MTGVSTCLHHGVAIHRNVAPRDWKAALAAVPAECRAECETYLRQIAARMRARRALLARDNGRWNR